MERVFRWTFCVFLGCCDYTDNGSSYVNAASKHDGPLDTTDESSFFGHNRNGELKNLICFVFLDFLNKVPYSVLTGIIRKIGSIPNKLHLHTYSILGHTYSLDKAEGSTALHLNLSYFLFSRHNPPGIMSVFWKSVFMHAPANLDLVT